ncbi:GL12989 [Drosophila persimilis]|uniref:GL12989 n=1 Tax=Drosophila persimilis TaxID=7234 RepID=B4GVD7_DROPE|nr:GL12989 [Drosophila persimilis]
MLLPELLLLLGLAVSMSESYDGSVNYWEAFSPGKLLQRLDALTLTDVDQSKMGKLPEMIQVLAGTQSQAKAQAEPKADDDVDVADDDVESLSGETSHEAPHSGEDYERNYEKFVKEYFDRASSDDGDADGDEGSSSLEQTQAEASNRKDQRCRRVQRQGQLCEICRQAKNNEVSETCSYSNAEQPQKYAYDMGSQYKRYRDNPQEDDDGSEQESVTVEAKEESSAPSSLCVRRQKGKRVCYQCKDSKGKRLERCYDVQEKRRKEKAISAVASKTKSKASSSKRKPRAQQSQQSEQEQRIYKRTISYSYAQGTNPDEEQPPPAEITTEAVALPANQHRRRRLVKILRRRGPVP